MNFVNRDFLVVFFLVSSSVGCVVSESPDGGTDEAAPTVNGSANDSTPRIRASCPASFEGRLNCGETLDGSGNNGVLMCVNGQWAHMFDCPTIQTCHPTRDFTSVRCGDPETGTPYAVLGAGCETDGNAACSPERDIIYWCEQGTWVEAQHCAPSQCVRFDDTATIACENQGITEGDMCRTTSAGAVFCSTDLTKILACENGTAVVHRDCGSDRCTRVDDSSLACR